MLSEVDSRKERLVITTRFKKLGIIKKCFFLEIEHENQAQKRLVSEAATHQKQVKCKTGSVSHSTEDIIRPS